MSLLETKCVVSFNCTYCNKHLSTKQNCNRHMKICKSKENYFEEENKKLKELLKEKEEQIKFLGEQIKILQNIIDSKNQSVSTTTTIINNNYKPNTINNIFANIDPIDFKSDESKYAFEQKFLNHHIDKGQEGLVRFMCENICKDKIVVSDIARKKLQYKNTEGKIVTDHKGELLLTSAIKENTDIFDKKVNNRHNCIKKQLNTQKLDDEPVDKELYEKNRKIKELIEIKDNIDNDNPIDIKTEAVKIFVACGNKTKNNLYLTS